jgi:hypothetical protein
VISRTEPQASAELAVTSAEIDLLARAVQDSPRAAQAPPILRNVIKVARLGGSHARAGDPKSRKRVMWRGMQRLTNIQFGYELALKNSGQLQAWSDGYRVSVIRRAGGSPSRCATAFWSRSANWVLSFMACSLNDWHYWTVTARGFNGPRLPTLIDRQPLV